MDLSKLPRLSNTQKAAQEAGGEGSDPSPAPQAQPAGIPQPTPGTFCHQCGAPLRPGARFCDSCATPLAATGMARQDAEPTVELGAAAWLSLILGFVFVAMGWRFARYAWTTLRGQRFDTKTLWEAGEKAGQPVDYWELLGMPAWTESGIFLFGLALIFEAVAMIAASTRMPARRALIGVALFITVLATVYNLYVAFLFLSQGMVPLLSLLAVAFGGYIAAYEWQQLRALARSA